MTDFTEPEYTRLKEMKARIEREQASALEKENAQLKTELCEHKRRLANMDAQLAGLRAGITALLEYRDRAGALSLQVEKLDDYLKALRALLGE